MIHRIYSGLVSGITGVVVSVEVEVVSRSFPTFKIVGMPHKSVAEAKERVRSAIRNAGYKIPGARIIVNLAPADIPKKGALYDVPIALGIISATETFQNTVFEESLFIGELSLNGDILPVPGAVPIVLNALDQGYKQIYIPWKNYFNVLNQKNALIPVRKLSELVAYLTGKAQPCVPNVPIPSGIQEQIFPSIKGQAQAKRALEIAVAGWHSLLMQGPPGTGKSLLAQASKTLLPPPTLGEEAEILKIRSIDNSYALQAERPFCAPHHTISTIGLLGSPRTGSIGEVTRAHGGVLCLDELPEYSRAVLESLREPLETGFVSLTWKNGNIQYPSRFLLIATANPCPCGYLGHPKRQCVCSQQNIQMYKRKISGALADRIDLHVRVPHVDSEDLTESDQSILVVKKRIALAYARQRERYSAIASACVIQNGDLTHTNIESLCRIEKSAYDLLDKAYVQFSLSVRSRYKTIKIAQTIADLEGAESIHTHHIAEALHYRPAG